MTASCPVPQPVTLTLTAGYPLAPFGSGGSCRLVVKVLVRYPRGPLQRRLGSRLLPWGDLLMMRRQLLNLKALAEQGA